MFQKITNLVTIFLLLTVSYHPLIAQDTLSKPPLWLVETLDGNTFTGEILKQDAEGIQLKTADFGSITIVKSNIRSMQPIDPEKMKGKDYWKDNDYARSYFFTPSGYPHTPKTWSYQNSELIFNQINYGIDEYVGVSAGVALPLFLGEVNALPIWVSTKVSLPIVKNKINVAIGGLYFTPLGNSDLDDGRFWILYGVTTFGSMNHNFSIGVNYGKAFTDESALGTSFTFAGMTRTGKKHYLILDGLVSRSDGYNQGLILIGGRWTGKDLAVDYGLGQYIETSCEICGTNLALTPWIGLKVPFK